MEEQNILKNYMNFEYLNRRVILIVFVEVRVVYVLIKSFFLITL